MGLLEALTVLFVVLKLIDVIDWSWWLVFAPMYVYVVVFAIWLFFAMLAGFVAGVSNEIDKRNRRK